MFTRMNPECHQVCETYQTELQSGIEDLKILEIKDQCSETLLTDETMRFSETLPCDGNAVAAVHSLLRPMHTHCHHR